MLCSFSAAVLKIILIFLDLLIRQDDGSRSIFYAPFSANTVSRVVSVFEWAIARVCFVLSPFSALTFRFSASPGILLCESKRQNKEFL